MASLAGAHALNSANYSRCKITCSYVVLQDMAAADKERVDKLKADMPPVPKPTKPAKADKPDKVPRAKTAYVV